MYTFLSLILWEPVKYLHKKWEGTLASTFKRRKIMILKNSWVADTCLPISCTFHSIRTEYGTDKQAVETTIANCAFLWRCLKVLRSCHNNYSFLKDIPRKMEMNHPITARMWRQTCRAQIPTSSSQQSWLTYLLFFQLQAFLEHAKSTCGKLWGFLPTREPRGIWCNAWAIS